MNHRITTGFFVENTIVLAEGEMLLDGIFQVCVNFALWPIIKLYHWNLWMQMMILNVNLCYWYSIIFTFVTWYTNLLRLSTNFLPIDLQVKTCGFPPLEDREKSISMFAGVDYFGGGSLTKEETVSFNNTYWVKESTWPINDKNITDSAFQLLLQIRLAELEKGAVNDMFVILSDVWLDDDNVITESVFCFLCCLGFVLLCLCACRVDFGY